jgi:phosphoribosylaminoimidazole carboxylase (NCAIR synthetase)
MSRKSLKLGIIGGGQLGMFIAKSAMNQKIASYVYSDTKMHLLKNMLIGSFMENLMIKKNYLNSVEKLILLRMNLKIFQLEH